MALTKVTGQVINTSTDVTVGVLTVTNTLAVGGTVSIGGTLTYEDVTNIDSVGLITARNGIIVGSGITLSKDGDVFFTGIATGNGSGLTNLPAANLTGTLPAISGANLTNLDASDLASGTVPTARLGSGTASSSTFLRGDSTFQTVNTDLVSDTSPQLGGNLDVNGKNIVFANSGGANDDRIVYGASANYTLFFDGSSGVVQVTDSSAKLRLGGPTVEVVDQANAETMAKFISDGAVELYYDNVKKFETLTDGIKVSSNNASLELQGLSGGTSTAFAKFKGYRIVGDIGRLGELQFINQRDNDVQAEIEVIANGDTNSYFDFKTNNAGLRTLRVDHAGANFPDSIKARFGAGEDLQIYHDGSHSRIVDNGTGNLNIQGSQVTVLNAAGSENMIKAVENGAVELYYDNVKKFETNSDGVLVTRNSSDTTMSNTSQFVLRNTNDGGNTLAGIRFEVSSNTASDHFIVQKKHSGGSGTDLIVGHGSNERIRFVESGGITFHGDTAAANALDDYEEGTFTPSNVSAYGVADSFSGKYVKVGALVHFEIQQTGGTYGPVSGRALGGLPFQPEGRAVGSVTNDSASISSNVLIYDNSYIYFTTNHGNQSTYKITGTYKTAA